MYNRDHIEFVFLWLISLSRKPLRSFHVVRNSKISFFFMVEQYSIVYPISIYPLRHILCETFSRNHCPFSCSLNWFTCFFTFLPCSVYVSIIVIGLFPYIFSLLSLDGYLYSFHAVATMNNAVMSMGVSLGELLLSPSEYIFRGRIAKSLRVMFLKIWGKYTFFIVTTFNSHWQCTRLHLSSALSLVFLMMNILIGVRCYFGIYVCLIKKGGPPLCLGPRVLRLTIYTLWCGRIWMVGSVVPGT